VNKDAAKRKQMKDMQLKHNDDIKINDSAVEQAVEPEKKVDKVVKPIEDEKPEVIIEQLEKEIKEAETPKPVPEAPKPIETKPLSDNKKVSVDDKKDAVKDVIKEKVKKIESDSKAIVEIKPTEKTVEKKAITKP
jgi:CHAD domain-containing protein